ncbi:hypothetical protein T484DRAFT_1983003 [Baffinella frigidus]|nr:hypothetical protein T484DRAFT_1983003 [Cryptophyta sp. CCMP2293]
MSAGMMQRAAAIARSKPSVYEVRRMRPEDIQEQAKLRGAMIKASFEESKKIIFGNMPKFQQDRITSEMTQHQMDQMVVEGVSPNRGKPTSTPPFDPYGVEKPMREKAPKMTPLQRDEMDKVAFHTLHRVSSAPSTPGIKRTPSDPKRFPASLGGDIRRSSSGGAGDATRTPSGNRRPPSTPGGDIRRSSSGEGDIGRSQSGEGGFGRTPSGARSPTETRWRQSCATRV